MKRLLTSLALCAMALTTFSACTPKETTQEPAPTPSVSELTPDEHKQKLEDIAIELVDEFNPSDFELLANAFISLSEYLYTEEWDDESQEYPVEQMARALKTKSMGDLTKAATRASEQFIFDLNNGAIELDGLRFVIDEDGEVYYEELESTGRVEVTWDNAVVLFTWGENNGQYTYTDEAEDIEYVVKVPAYVNASLKIDGVEHLNVNAEPAVTNNDDLALNLTIKIYGGYEITNAANVTNEKVTYNSSFKKNAKTLISNSAELYINGLTTPENWISEYTNEDEYGNEYTETYLSLDESVYETMTNGQFRCDILKLSIIGSGDFKEILTEMETLNNESTTYNDIAYYEAYSDILNKHTDIVAVYNDTNEKIANVITQGFYYEEEYIEDGTSYVEIGCGVEPILVFPDGSKFSLEEFFTADSFEDLIEHLEDIY
ncbi:MAG: hypothetical protein J6V55_02210 [Alistipes sp.]|nr:hypothetical protein [Alistipes sp.]